MHVAARYHGTPNQTSPNSGNVPIGHTHNHAKFYRVQPNARKAAQREKREKRYKNFFTPFTLLVPHRGITWANFHQPRCCCIARPPLSSCQISSRSENPSVRHLPPNFIDFVDGLTHTQNSRRYLSAYHATTINLGTLGFGFAHPLLTGDDTMAEICALSSAGYCVLLNCWDKTSATELFRLSCVASRYETVVCVNGT